MFRRIATNTFASIVALSLIVAPSIASAADEDGTAGLAYDLQVLTASADTHLQYHGRLILLVGTAQVEYRWGGSSCGSRTMSEDNIRLMKEAIREGLTVTPRFQAGQGDSKCLVGFSAQKIALSGGGGPH
jgi:hypothetical protein